MAQWCLGPVFKIVAVPINTLVVFVGLTANQGVASIAKP